MAAKKKTTKSEDEGSARLKTPVSQTDQAYLGAKSIDEIDLEAEHGFYAVNTGTANVRRDNSEYAGNSAPRTWEQVYRENATDVDIRAGAKPKFAKESK